MVYSPTTLMLKDIENRLGVLNIPIYFYLPHSSVMEPFLVIGKHSTDTSKTAQSGAIIEDMKVSIDIFFPSESRLEAEEIRSKTVRALGRETRLSSTILMDDTIGREVYHIVIQFTTTIM